MFLHGVVGIMNALTDRRIVVTRAESQADPLVEPLRSHGADVLVFPCIAIVPPAVPPEFGIVGDYDWIVLTSVNAVEMFFSSLEALDQNPGTWTRPRIAAVGPATSEAVRLYVKHIDLMPDTYVGEALFEALKEREGSLRKKRILLPRGDLARDFLPTALREHGAEVTEAIVYQTVAPEVSEEAIQTLMTYRPALVTFTSPSTAQNFAAILGPERLDTTKAAATFASIGPVTSQAMKNSGMASAVEANPHDIPGLVQAILRWAAEEG
jgi:uroporphyrinogen-III synthase